MTTLEQKRNNSLLGNKYFVIFVFFAIGFSIYGNVIGGKFLWDDDNNIVNNSYIKDGGHIGDFFTKDLLAGSGQTIGWYRPALLISYAIDYGIWHLNPVGYHLTNIFLHVFSSLILFLIVLKIFYKWSVAFLSSLLFLIHPVQTEAVSYISGRADLLLVFLSLSSFYFFLLFQESNTVKRSAIFYGASILSFVLALLSKETAIVFPLLLILFILTLGKRAGRLSFEKTSLIIAPFLAISAVYQILRMTLLNFGHSFTVSGADIGHRMLMFLKAMPIYWKLIFIPLDLHYHFERKLVINGWDWMIATSIAVLILIVLSYVRLNSQRKFIIFGLGWFFISLIPVSGVFVAINFIIGERWLYFSAVGIFIFIALCIDKISTAISSKRNKSILIILLVIYLSFLGVLGVKRNFVWKNGVSLLTDTLKYAPNDPKLHNSLGLEYIKEGQDDEALQEFKLASSIDPADALIHYNLGVFYATHKINKEAIYEFEKMVSLNQNLKFGYGMLADLNYQNKEYVETLSWLEKLSVISQDSWEVYYKLAIAYNLLGDKKNSDGALNQAIKLNPDLMNKLRQ